MEVFAIAACVLAVAAGVACAAVAAFSRKRLADKDAAHAAVLREKDAACSAMLREKDAACSRLLAEKDAMLSRTFAETVKTLREQFATLAAQTLKSQSADLAETSNARLESVLKPLREQMARLQDATAKAEFERAHLGQTISKDVDAIGKIARDLTGVADALSSNTRVQGRSGEDILAEKLRQAGLEENVNFFLQTGTGADRPDAQVCDTENRWLVIDSKVSLTAYMEYMAATDETAKAARLAAHVASVRGKIGQLAKKRYPDALAAEYRDRDYLPVTAMFVPYEAPLMAALKADPSLWQYAAQNNVVLVTPLTLMAYIRLVYLAWQHEKELGSQRKMAEAARALLSRMNSFLAAFEQLGRSIDSLKEEYGRAGTVLIDAPRTHTIAKAARRLLDLGVRLETERGRKTETAACLACEAADGIAAAEDGSGAAPDCRPSGLPAMPQPTVSR